MEMKFNTVLKNKNIMTLDIENYLDKTYHSAYIGDDNLPSEYDIDDIICDIRWTLVAKECKDGLFNFDILIDEEDGILTTIHYTRETEWAEGNDPQRAVTMQEKKYYEQHVETEFKIKIIINDSHIAYGINIKDVQIDFKKLEITVNF